jgi:hypothetical protein
MKKIIIALLFIYSVAEAQVPTLGLNIQTVYTGIKMPLIFNPGCEKINKIKFDVENGEIVKEDNAYYLIAKSNGAVIVKIKSGNREVANYNFKSKPMPDLNITVGNIKSRRIEASVFSLQTGLKCVLPDFLHEDDYKVISATVYFSGTNFKDVAVATITNSFNSMQPLLDKCDVGTVITFDNVKVQGPTGIMTTNGLSIALY